MRILHFCEEDNATSWQRTKAFESIAEFELSLLWHSPMKYSFPLLKRIIHSVFHRIKFPLDKFSANKRLLTKVENEEFDILFLEKCLALRPKTLIRIKQIQPNCRLILYMLDDFNGTGNNSFYFQKCIPIYDLIATNKKHNILEYLEIGAQRVHYFKNAYSKYVHRVITLVDSERDFYQSDVCFVGTYEKDRADSLLHLAKNGIQITIWGWSRDSKYSGIEHPNIINNGKHVYFDEFAKVISGAKINLNFLRKANRDTETTRSVEIPACGGFMIAERTKEHQELFCEDEEAVYFGNKKELLEKVKYYLENDLIRKKISKNGLVKITNSKFEYKDQLIEIISQI